MSGLSVYLNVLTKPHFRQGSVLLNIHVTCIAQAN